MMQATAERTKQTPDKNAIRPFRVNVAEAELTELRRRINATRWPDRETVRDATQGVQLATTQAFARYWATEPRHGPPSTWRGTQRHLRVIQKRA